MAHSQLRDVPLNPLPSLPQSNHCPGRHAHFLVSSRAISRLFLCLSLLCVPPRCISSVLHALAFSESVRLRAICWDVFISHHAGCVSQRSLTLTAVPHSTAGCVSVRLPSLLSASTRQSCREHPAHE